tara:strand:+ start:433 stop:621 length:189 start_codon:yes stop_codon:yes gene_type:complete
MVPTIEIAGGASTDATTALETRNKLEIEGQKPEHLKTFPHPRNPGKRVNLTHKLERKDSKNS